MGILYRDGIGVQRSSTQARSWWARAAEMGSALAALDLSELYFNGETVAVDVDRAAALCEDAARLGNADGLITLGLVYEQQWCGVEKNPMLAAEYFSRAVAMKSARAKYHLARLHIIGSGVRKDIAQALQLLTESADANDAEGLNALAYVYETGYEGIPEDHQRARVLYGAAARLGHPNAKLSLQRFPDILELGAIVASPGAARLMQEDLAQVLSCQRAGNWGEIDEDEWERNEAALKSRGTIRSIHRAPHFSVIVTTNIRDRDTFVQLAGEQPSSAADTFFDAVDKVLKLVQLANALRS